MDKKPLNFNMNGAGTFYRNPLIPNAIYTDGCAYVADELNAHWLIDDILLYSTTQESIKQLSFMTWALKKDGESSAALRAEDGNYKLLWKTDIPFTDFDFDRIPNQGLHIKGERITFFYEFGTLMLPEER